MIVNRAPAKVNLCLSVGARGGELHKIASVMQTVSLVDDLRIEPSEHPDVSFEWESGLSGSLPAQPDLIARALEAAERIISPSYYRIRVTKRIPIGAGLGGGSADAACVLRFLADSTPSEGWMEVAAALGSDVPFCFVGGTALVRGTGESITALAGVPKMWWVIGVSEASLSTRDVFERFDLLGDAEPADPMRMVEAADSGDLELVGSLMGNDLQAAAINLMPALGPKIAAMKDAGALGAVVTGSGPTVLGLASSPDHAKTVQSAICEVFDRVEVVSSSS